jgi:hypothetical protein
LGRVLLWSAPGPCGLGLPARQAQPSPETRLAGSGPPGGPPRRPKSLEKPRDYCKNRDISSTLGLIRPKLSLFRPSFRGPGGLLRPAGLLGLLGSPSQPGPTGWVSAQGWPSRPNNPAQPDPSRVWPDPSRSLIIGLVSARASLPKDSTKE